MSVPARIFWSSVLTACVAILAVVLLLVWFAAQTDKIANDDAKMRVLATLSERVEANAILTADYSNWGFAHEIYQQRDDDALYDNIGSGAAEAESFDTIYLLSPQGVATHAYSSEELGSDTYIVEPDILAATLPRLGDLPLEPHAVVSGLMLIDGGLVAVSAGRIQPDDVSALTPADLPVLIGSNWVDLEAMGNLLMIDDLQIAPPGAAQADNRESTQITGFDDKPVALLSWERQRPGLVLLGRALPVVLTLALFLLVASWISGRTAAVQAQDYLREKNAARTDPFTKLLNRKGLAELSHDPQVVEAIDAGRAAMIFVDLNGLKTMNDTHGHTVGDSAIAVTAKRLRGAVRSDDHVARLGGDEFVCLIIDDDVETVAQNIADRIIHRTQRPFSVLDQSHIATASIGIALSQPGLSWDMLMDQADEAMYQAKRRKSDRAVIFSKVMKEAS